MRKWSIHPAINGPVIKVAYKHEWKTIALSYINPLEVKSHEQKKTGPDTWDLKIVYNGVKEPLVFETNERDSLYLLGQAFDYWYKARR